MYLVSLGVAGELLMTFPLAGATDDFVVPGGIRAVFLRYLVWDLLIVAVLLFSTLIFLDEGLGRLVDRSSLGKLPDWLKTAFFGSVVVALWAFSTFFQMGQDFGVFKTDLYQ